MDDDEAPGWDAIEAAVGQHLRPEGGPMHWSTGLLPGQDGVYGISAYRLPGVWFFVTFGLSELYAKESDDPAVSGWGFELTMRTPRKHAKEQPPGWPLTLLRQLGAYVFTNGSPFGPGHRLDPGSTITGSPDTRLTAVAFTTDAKLPEIQTPNGSLEFLQVVGITGAELQRMHESSTAEVLQDVARQSPELVTDPAR
ncbi:MAG TPA: suppressor of fused domain protein [Intrasporangium sp.]|uniref:suppressor of fused domain protein n=1 Tax=Intrasporangium sp. TaxID=1925024 RepID=UPI002B45DB1C|nr:suppressor of fused domain protein [Intrasporangium sp.]HKX67437.1 suppressor of fused domain protein [Intrasporangium sp.]